MLGKHPRPSVVVKHRAADTPAEHREEKLALTKKEAAAKLSISEKTLQNLYRSGEIPVITLKRKLLFRPADLDAWLISKSSNRQ